MSAEALAWGKDPAANGERLSGSSLLYVFRNRSPENNYLTT